MNKRRVARKRNAKEFRAPRGGQLLPKVHRPKLTENARMHNYLAEKHPEMELFSITI